MQEDDRKDIQWLPVGCIHSSAVGVYIKWTIKMSEMSVFDDLLSPLQTSLAVDVLNGRK